MCMRCSWLLLGDLGSGALYGYGAGCSTAQKVPKEPPFGVFRSKQGSVSLLGPAEDLHTQNRRDWHRPSAQMGAKVKHDRGTRLTTVFSTFFTKY